jgi:hypothetical protein
MGRSPTAALVLWAACAAGSAAAGPGFGSVKYGEGQVFQTGIYKPRLIATLPAGATKPVLVLSGLGCHECDINLSIYIHPVARGAMQPGERAPRYSHPGRYHDYLSQTLVKTVRMFVGQCTPDGKPGVIWFHNTKMESGKWERSSFNVQVESTQLVELSQPPVQSTLQAAQSAVAAGSCKEVAGKRFTTEP